MFLNEVRMGYVPTANGFVEVLHEGINKFRFQAFYLDGDNHWRLEPFRGTPSSKPSRRSWSGGPILGHGLLLGTATDSGRSDIFLAALTPVTARRYRADGGFRDFGNDVDPHDSAHD